MFVLTLENHNDGVYSLFDSDIEELAFALPINKLIVATNQNDILHRAISKGDYTSKKVSETFSPSMDIQLASNFERLIFELQGCNSNKTKNIMAKVKENNYKLDEISLNKINKDFLSEKLSEDETINEIKEVFKNKIPSISSTKSMTGHTLGAAGALESVFSIMTLKDGIIPPTINLNNPDPKCDLDYTPNVAREKKVQIVMNNSFGFGGTNASLIFGSID